MSVQTYATRRTRDVITSSAAIRKYRVQRDRQYRQESPPKRERGLPGRPR